MNKTVRILCLVLVLAMCAGLAACGSGSTDAAGGTQSAASGAKSAAEIAIPTAACGIIIDVMTEQTSLATNLSGVIASLGMTSLFLAMLIAMVGCMFAWFMVFVTHLAFRRQRDRFPGRVDVFRFRGFAAFFGKVADNGKIEFSVLDQFDGFLADRLFKSYRIQCRIRIFAFHREDDCTEQCQRTD